jgi:hypothetical protein
MKALSCIVVTLFVMVVDATSGHPSSAFGRRGTRTSSSNSSAESHWSSTGVQGLDHDENRSDKIKQVKKKTDKGLGKEQSHNNSSQRNLMQKVSQAGSVFRMDPLDPNLGVN